MEVIICFRPEFFGKFGKIIKVAVGTAQALNNSTPPTHTSYVTYARNEDALRAIQAVNNMVVDGRLLKASLGTTKYCSNFLKGQACHKPVKHIHFLFSPDMHNYNKKTSVLTIKLLSKFFKNE